MPLSLPPGTLIKSIDAKMKRENKSYVQGTLHLTDEVLAFRPAPFFPEIHFTILKDDLIDAKILRTERSVTDGVMQLSLFLDVIYKDDQNQVHHHDVLCWNSGPAMVDNINWWLGRPITGSKHIIHTTPIPARPSLAIDET